MSLPGNMHNMPRSHRTTYEEVYTLLYYHNICNYVFCYIIFMYIIIIFLLINFKYKDIICIFY